MSQSRRSLASLLILAILLVPFHSCATTSPRAPSGGTSLTESDIGHDVLVIVKGHDRYLGTLVQFDDEELRLVKNEVTIVIDRSEIYKMEIHDRMSGAQIAARGVPLFLAGAVVFTLLFGYGMIYLLAD